MKRFKQPVIRNSKGEKIVLNRIEQGEADYWEKRINRRFANALGAEVSITTLTMVIKEITDQAFYQVAPADYVPIKAGQGTWETQLTTFRSFDIAGEFEEGIINTGGNNARVASADAGVDALNIKIFPWAKGVGWSIFEIEYASKSGNWDLIAAKEETRKRNWDLGIQRLAFLGARGLNASGGSCLGLFNQAGITVNTSVIQGPIKSMGTAALKQFCSTVITAYRENCNHTKWPTHFVIPESDYTGLAGMASADFPIKSTLQLLEETFKTMCQNPNFKILPSVYADHEISGFSYQQYCLYNYDPRSLRMDVPLPYTNTLANTLDGLNFQNGAYGQFTGVLAYRPLEMLYFQFTP